MSGHRIREIPPAITETARTFVACPNCGANATVPLVERKASCPRCSTIWNWKDLPRPRKLRTAC